MDAIVAGLLALAATEDPDKRKRLADSIRDKVEIMTNSLRDIKDKECHIAARLRDIKEIERNIAEAQRVIKEREANLVEHNNELLMKIIDILSEWP